MIKNREIEFWRFIVAIMIILFHIHKELYGDPSFSGWSFCFFCHGSIGVEFFFIISGILLGKKLYSLKEETFVVKEVGFELNKKLSVIFPQHLYAIIITMAVYAFIKDYTLRETMKFCLDSVSSILLVQCLGFNSSWVNGAIWYLSVLLISFVILYVLGRKYYYMCKNFVFPLVAILVLGYLDYTTGSLTGVKEWVGISYKCVLRGISEMALGCWLYEKAYTLSKKNCTKLGKVIFTIIQIFGYTAMFVYGTVNSYRTYEFIVLFLIALSVMISFSNQSYLTKFMSFKLFDKMGKLSLPVYLNQYYCIYLIMYFFEFENPAYYYVAIVLADILAAVLCLLVANKIKIMYSWIKNEIFI